MQVPSFDLERWQSLHEHQVEINLSESGVEPLRLEELTDAIGDVLGPIEPGYAQTNGSAALRDRIAALYPGTGLAEILVTNGSAEANFICAWHLIEPGDEIVVVPPNYMQVANSLRPTSSRRDRSRETNGDPDHLRPDQRETGAH